MAKIKYNSIKISAIQNSSGIFYGENIQYRWRNKVKKSEGFGNVKGNENKITNNFTAVSGKKR